jgi:hypothetical protein
MAVLHASYYIALCQCVHWTFIAGGWPLIKDEESCAAAAVPCTEQENEPAM